MANYLQYAPDHACPSCKRNIPPDVATNLDAQTPTKTKETNRDQVKHPDSQFCAETTSKDKVDLHDTRASRRDAAIDNKGRGRTDSQR